MDTQGLKAVWSDKFLDWQLGEEHPVNPLRGFLAVGMLNQLEGTEVRIDRLWDRAGEIEQEKWLFAAEKLQPKARKLVEERPELLWMFGGTFVLVEELIRDRALDGHANVYFNPAGGELSGQHPDVEVLNDLSYAAVRLTDAGLRVAVVSLDAHHANQTESLLRGRKDIPTYSIHEAESASTTYSNESFVNFGLPDGAGDQELLAAVQEIVEDLRGRDLDVLLMDIGTDGLEGDSQSSLRYTGEGLSMAAVEFGKLVGEKECSVLLGGGGAGGELSVDEVPVLWANMVLILSGTMWFEMVGKKTLMGSVDTFPEGV